MTTNADYFFQEPDDAFKKFLLVSVILHVSLALFLLIRGIVFSGQVIEIQNSIRVDVVALPDKMPEVVAPPAPQVAAEKPVNIKPKSEPKKENLKEAQKKALDKMKALSAIDKLKKEISQEAAKTPPAAKPAQFKGNYITSGNSFSGIARLRVNEYYENLVAQVREHWVVPEWLNNTNLKAAIVISIDERGYIIKKEVHTPSGNSVFDSSCLAAVTDASPFAPPPAEVKEALIMIRFPFQ